MLSPLFAHYSIVVDVVLKNAPEGLSDGNNKQIERKEFVKTIELPKKAEPIKSDIKEEFKRLQERPKQEIQKGAEEEWLTVSPYPFLPQHKMYNYIFDLFRYSAKS